MSHLHLFPARFVYTETIQNHTQIKETLLPLIQGHSLTIPTNKGSYYQRSGTLTSYFDASNFLMVLLESCGLTKNIVWDPFDRMLAHPDLKLARTPFESRISSIWYNIYSSGSFHHPHTHLGDASFCGIYLLDLQESNNTLFYQSGIPSMEHTHSTEDLKEGSIILFPADLIHSVYEVKHPRTSIAFNISSRF